MDPYSAEGELINIHNHFHQGQYQEVVDFDVSALSPENALPARVLQLRARIALGQAEEVLDEVKGETEPELEAVGALAEQALGNNEAAVKTIEKLAETAADNVTVQVVGGTVLQAAGKSEEALALLSQHQGSCAFHVPFPPFFLMRGERQRADNKIAMCSGCRRAYCANPSSTEQERPRSQGGHCRTAVGAGQPVGEPRRVVGWVETGGAYQTTYDIHPPFVPVPPSSRALLDTDRPGRFRRAARNINKRFTSSRSSRKRRRHRRYGHWSPRPCRNCTSAGQRRRRLRWSKR